MSRLRFRSSDWHNGERIGSKSPASIKKVMHMTAGIPHRVGIYFALVQFFFTLTWTIYVIFLPRLAAEVGIPKECVVFILLADQLIFIIMDFSMGLIADRVSQVLGKLGYVILGVTLGSCI